MANYVTSIDSKATKVALVIDPDHSRGQTFISVDTLDALERWCSVSCERWAYAVHDLDVDSEGKPKEAHVHVFMHLNSCQRMSTTLNKLADALGYGDVMAVHIRKCTSPSALVQYFLHKNDPDKHQYPKSVIRTDLPEGELEAMLNDETAQISVSYLVSLCARSRSLIQVIEALGLNKYQAWRSVVLDIWYSCHK